MVDCSGRSCGVLLRRQDGKTVDYYVDHGNSERCLASVISPAFELPMSRRAQAERTFAKLGGTSYLQ